MKTKYVLTNTNPDDMDGDDCFEDSLEFCRTFANLRKARAEFKNRVNGGTNMHVYLLEVKLLDDAEGHLPEAKVVPIDFDVVDANRR